MFFAPAALSARGLDTSFARLVLGSAEDPWQKYYLLRQGNFISVSYSVVGLRSYADIYSHI